MSEPAQKYSIYEQIYTLELFITLKMAYRYFLF